jgi:hypothetical protein
MEKTLGDLAGAEKVNDQPQLAEIGEENTTKILVMRRVGIALDLLMRMQR